MALLAGVGAHPLELQPIFPTTPVVTAVFIGAGLGLLIRYLALQGWHGPVNREATLSLVLLALAILFLFQPSLTHLADSAGAPAFFRMEVMDPTTLLPTVVSRHIAIHLPHPLAPFAPILAALLIVASWVGLARVGSVQRRYRFVIFVNVATIIALMAAIVLPLLGGVELDAELVRQDLNLRAGGRGAITALTMPGLSLAPWSRVPMDAFRLLLALGALTLTLSRGRPIRGSAAQPNPNLVLLAIGAFIVAFGLHAMIPEAIAGVGLILLTAVIAGRAGSTEAAAATGHGVAKAPQVAFLAALFLLLVTISFAPLNP